MSDECLKVEITLPGEGSKYLVTLYDDFAYIRHELAITLWGAKWAGRRMLNAERKFRTKRNEWTYQ